MKRKTSPQKMIFEKIINNKNKETKKKINLSKNLCIKTILY